MINRNKTGFTLLEVMVAMAIMAITLVALLDSESASISRASEAKFTISASFLAQKKMAEIEVLKPEELISDSGDFGDEYPGYSWELSVENPSFDSPPNVLDHLKQVDLTINWGEDEVYSYKLKQYRFTPVQ